METDILNPAEVTNYFNDIIEESLSSGTYSFSKTDYDPEAPEFYFTQCWFSMGLSMARRTKMLFENARNRKCEKCIEMDFKFEQISCKLSDLTKSYNLLLSSVQACDPVLSQKFIESQKKMSVPCSPKGGENSRRTPLTPVKYSNNNIMRDKGVSSNYSSPKQQNSNNRDSQIYSSKIVGIGSPLHSSTQAILQVDENMKIKNTLTPKKKKKKEISPLKSSPSNNVCIYSQIFTENKLGTKIHNDSCDSIEILPETPPGQGVGQKESFKNGVGRKEPILHKYEVEDVEDENNLTPLIPRTRIEDIKLSKTPEQNDEYEEIGISPSIMSDRVPARNLNDSFGIGTPEIKPETSLKDFPRNTRTSSQLLNTTDVLHATPPTKVTSARKGKHNWVTTEPKKVGNRLNSSSSSSFSISFKPPPLNKGKRLKQMTLLQMNKKATKNVDVNVDISTLEEFDGGTRPMKGSLKRKSDEKNKNENMTDPHNQKYVRSEQAHDYANSDETAFDEFALQDVPKPSSSKAYQKGNKNFNATTELLDNLDRMPYVQSQEPAFAYKPERAIRKKEERAKLTGFDCEECRKYYEAMGIDEDPTFIQRLKNKCSKHRAKHPVNLNGTPPGYWETGFPSTEEQKRTKAFRTDSCLESDEDDQN